MRFMMEAKQSTGQSRKKEEEEKKTRQIDRQTDRQLDGFGRETEEIDKGRSGDKQKGTSVSEIN
jgi:hypothetical protein